MNRIWTLVLSFVVSGLAQKSSNTTLFLISGPEVLYAGLPTSLAVTVFSNFPGKLTAEVGHGDTKVTQTESFQGGLTKVLVLPPFPGSIPPNSLLNLTVWGYRENSLIFSNSTTLTLNLRNVPFFIQTDRTRYNQGDAVKIRVVSVRLDNKAYTGGVELSLLDPSGRAVDRWNSTGTLGIVLKEFSLSRTSPFGRWLITATVNKVTQKKEIIVENRDDPPFKVLVKTSSRFLVGDDVSGSVRAIYPSGQLVRGTLVVSLTPDPFVKNKTSSFQQTQTKEIYGSTWFFFSKDQLQALSSSPAISSNNDIFHIVAQINDSRTGFTVTQTVDVRLVRNKFQLMFLNFQPSLKPSLHFSTSFKIRRYDGKPLDSLDLNNSAVVEVTQKTSSINTKPTTLRLPVPADGNVFIQFKLQDQVEMLFIWARFQSSEETLRIYNNYSSPSGSYIQISPINTPPAQIGLPLRLNVESTFQPATLHFVVSSKGQVVAAGTRNFSSSLDLTPAPSWFPEACVTVYCIRSDGELISDTAHIPIHQHAHVTLNWSSEWVQPGEQVSLGVAANEPKFQVAITVMGIRNDALQVDTEFRVEQKCNLKTITNAGFYENKQPDGPRNGSDALDDLIIEKYWSHWFDTSESLLWLDTNVSSNWTSEKITVPDGFTSLGAFALVMSENLGFGFTPGPIKMYVSKDFSLSLDVPPYIIRGEEIVLEVNITNHLERDTEIIVLIEQNEAFEFVLMDRRGASVINAHRLTLGSHESASALFPIRLLALGEMEVSVNAISAKASDKLVRRLLVKPEGVEQIITQTLFLELPPGSQSDSRSVSFSFPADVVPGSQKAHIVLVGDILALSTKNLDSLVQIPTGCGEQNMIHFAPSVYVLQYLDKSAHDDTGIRSKALSYMKTGYEKQLSYQRPDGSFSAFGTSDSSGSIWLTAFVLRCFLQAQSYIQINETVLSSAMTWLLRHQGSQGEFVEVGKVIHTELMGGPDDSPVALTAYVLLALLEDDTYSNMYEGNVSLALKYLESKVPSDVLSNYSLCLMAYALALDNRPSAGTVLAELSSRADYRDNVMMWTPSAGSWSYDPLPHSAQVEMASYVLLAFFLRGSFYEGISLMKWLSTQRNHLGGFGTTQDTVVALQALASYAAFSGASAIDLRFNISSPASSYASLFQINAINYRLYQKEEINAEKDLPLNIYMEGRGFATFQLNIFYNVESKNVSQNFRNTSKEAFSLDFNLTGSNSSDMILTVCTRLKNSQPIPETGMAILDVGMLSGFSLLPEAAVQADLIRKVDETPESINLYLDSVSKKEVCIRLPFVRNYKVAHVQDAVLQVYDYYEPTRKATRAYNSEFLHNMDSCFSCGENCDRCRAGITITLNSHATRGTYYSLSCLLLGPAAFLLLSH